ncbi:hypothetical protein ACFYP4_22575 [Streptomyces sp. NPDC005551]|uniref:hypothetical protein n=1 Tax=Streptomyces sp. NPDC005551 TaxID=3364725 RepID=UPI0036A0B5DC
MWEQSEDTLLEEALGALAGPGRRGAKFTAKRLRKNVGEAYLLVPLPFALALDRVRGALAEAAGGNSPWPLESGPDRAALRVLAGGGFGGLNPVVVTADLNADGPHGTGVHLRAAAKEGLIRQRAGEKTAERIVQILNR